MDELQNLRDIKDIVIIDLFNPLWLLLALVVALIVLGGIVFYYKKGRRKKHKFRLTPKEIAWRNIKNIDLNNPKEIAYLFSEDVVKFVDENKMDEYMSILNELEQFKYKKDIPDMDRELKKRVEKFIKGLRWVD